MDIEQAFEAIIFQFEKQLYDRLSNIKAKDREETDWKYCLEDLLKEINENKTIVRRHHQGRVANQIRKEFEYIEQE